MNIAKVKANEAPFNFYKKDEEKAKKRLEHAEAPPGADFVPFRA